MAKKMQVIENQPLGLYAFCSAKTGPEQEECGWVSKYVDTKEEANDLHRDHYREEHAQVSA